MNKIYLMHNQRFKYWTIGSIRDNTVKYLCVDGEWKDDFYCNIEARRFLTREEAVRTIGKYCVKKFTFYNEEGEKEEYYGE